jgi:hypothetical protein
MVDLAMRKELTSPFYGFHKLTVFERIHSIVYLKKLGASGGRCRKSWPRNLCTNLVNGSLARPGPLTNRKIPRYCGLMQQRARIVF